MVMSVFNKVSEVSTFFKSYKYTCIAAGLIGIQVFVTSPLYVIIKEVRNRWKLQQEIGLKKTEDQAKKEPASTDKLSDDDSKQSLAADPALNKKKSRLGRMLVAPQNFWIKYNVADRIQFNSFMNATSMMTWTLLAGMKYPKAAAYSGFAYVAGRFIYCVFEALQETMPGAAGIAVFGSMLCTLTTVINGVLSIFGGMKVYFKMMKQAYESVLEGLKDNKETISLSRFW